MSNIRLYHPNSIVENTTSLLSKEHTHYVANVMRLKRGSNINFFNQEEEWVSEVVFLEKDNVNEENSLIHVGDIAEQVTVRKHKLDVQNIQKVLHEGKNNKNLTIKDIAETLKVNKTTVDHWFRTDNSFSVPDKEIWFAVKKLLQINTDQLINK